MQISVRKMIELRNEIIRVKIEMAQEYTCAIKTKSLIIYKPAKKARATIKAINPKTIAIATAVSCSSTELIFFIIFNLRVKNKKDSLKGKLEKNLTIVVFKGKDLIQS